MVILHIGWDDTAWFVWGEQAATEDAQADWLPYAVPGTRLIQLLDGILWEPCQQEARAIEVELPSVKTGAQWTALPSRTIFAAGRTGRSSAGLKLLPWRMPAITLSHPQALILLSHLCETERLAEGLFAGAEMMALAQLLRYAGALCARGWLLPALERRGAHYYALWQPLLDHAERQRLHTLSAALPPVFRAGRPAAALAENLLECMVDQIARLSAGTTLTRAYAARGCFNSGHDAWLAALRADEPEVRWEEGEELDELSRTLREWSRPVTAACAGGPHVGFIMEPPADAAEAWFLRLMLWEEDEGAEKWREWPLQTLKAAEMTLASGYLRSLGQAATLYPALWQALPHAGGYGCLLRQEEACTFMSETAALLRATGYRVLLPQWWESEAASGREDLLIASFAEEPAEQREAEGQPPSPEALSARVQLDWSLTLAGTPITVAQLRELLAQGTPLVYFQGRWIRINLAQSQEALALIERRGAAPLGYEVLQMALGGRVQSELAVALAAGDGWLGRLVQQLTGVRQLELLAAPPDFKGTLRPYQAIGYSWLVFLRHWGLGSCLADDMGLGKTIQTLAFLLHERARAESPGAPVLLVAPISVIGNWQREIIRFAPGLRTTLHHGPQRTRGAAFIEQIQDSDLVLTGYNLLHLDYATLRQVRWAGIILDEAQNIKNPATRQSQAARALEGGFRIALTGTPLENHVGELWSIMDFLNPGMLGSRAHFRDTFLNPIQSGADQHGRIRLRRATAPFILRRLKSDREIAVELPRKVEQKLYCALTREQLRLYEERLEALSRELAETGAGIRRRGLILAALTSLKQICNHPAHYLGEEQAPLRHAGKTRRLEELQEELYSRGESSLIFTQYAKMGHLLQRGLSERFGREVLFMHGGINRHERDYLVRRFQEAHEPLTFVLSLKVGGVGLNLTRATHVFHFDRWWNPAVEQQATDRAYRIGQERDVMVHKFICGGTLEEHIDTMLEEKRELAEMVIGRSADFLTGLSDEDLQRVLRLTEPLITQEDT